MAAIIENPDAPGKLKDQLEEFITNCRGKLKREASDEIDSLEFRLLLPEILKRLQ